MSVFDLAASMIAICSSVGESLGRSTRCFAGSSISPFEGLGGGGGFFLEATCGLTAVEIST